MIGSFPLILILGGGLTIGAVCVGVECQHTAKPGQNIEPVALVTGPYRDCSDCTQQAMQIAWSLDHQPQQWSADEFHAHRRGVWIWIGNRDYGMQVGTDRSVAPDGFGWKPSQSDREMIWGAYSDWKTTVSLHASDIHP